MVFIFAKTPDEQLASLVSELDKLVEQNKSQKLAAVVNFTGTPTDEYLESIKELGEKAPNVGMGITSDAGKFKVNDEAEVTVMHYKGKKVAFNTAVADGELDEATVQKIIDGASTILQ